MNRISRGVAAVTLAAPFLVVPVLAPAAVAADFGYPGGRPGGSYSGLANGFAGAGPGQPGQSYGGQSYSGPSTVPTYGGVTTEIAAASEQESTGVVLVNTLLADGAAAGTGLVLESDGLVVTNHHVIEGAEQIVVTDPATGEQYAAEVVEDDPTDDVAVLQLEDASDLATVTIDDDGLSTGDAVTAVGNAEGEGVLAAADGTVTGLDVSIAVSEERGSDASQLSDLIQVDADIVSGDSGGALLDAEGEVVGMNVAASTGWNVTGYAIPIQTVLAVAAQV
ncbi:S1C family serine protease [Nocardioides sp.]|uniref:S1C family serine protease n=1 Tax=Nocardioides sp. TaxID=35761 RepID=UPI0039E573A2